MWLLFARAPPPDASYWPGRRWLAAVDAVAWPGLWLLGMARLPPPHGVVVIVIGALLIGIAMSRLHRAVWHNHRYRFTTWRWGRYLAWLLLLGVMLKLTLGN